MANYARRCNLDKMFNARSHLWLHNLTLDLYFPRKRIFRFMPKADSSLLYTTIIRAFTTYIRVCYNSIQSDRNYHTRRFYK